MPADQDRAGLAATVMVGAALVAIYAWFAIRTDRRIRALLDQARQGTDDDQAATPAEPQGVSDP